MRWSKDDKSSANLNKDDYMPFTEFMVGSLPRSNVDTDHVSISIREDPVPAEVGPGI